METYRGKKVFITGHTGFKGSWLLMLLNKFGAIVKGYALPPVHQTDLFPTINGDNLCESVYGDVRDHDKLKFEILTFQPDFIFHLAAQPLVRYSYKYPVETFSINMMGTINLLETLRSLSRKCIVIIVTTDKVYNNPENNIPFVEDDKLGGYDPYSASKACVEIITESYRNSFFDPLNYDRHLKSLATARAGNVIGGGDFSEDRIIPDIIRAFTSESVITIRNPDSVRPWQHVLEPLTGYLLLGAKMYHDTVNFCEAYNFGPEVSDKISVKELVQIAIESWGKGTYQVFSEITEPHEARFLMLDNKKAITSLNWNPKLDSSEAIKKTISWFKKDFNNKTNRRELILQDIEDYLYEQL